MSNDERADNQLRKAGYRPDDGPDHAVIRVPADWPDFIRRYWDGRWLDLNEVRPWAFALDRGAIIARPTGRFETRSDGAVAEIWEMGRDEGR